ncbi:uncharacterized protein RCC_07570 [Ramularia collo-cygni]|uniref:Uncharacterized protein n=1 Tax=Ramularia collo-cygni TaxID=112498 RepID=A0A2D3V4U3_9PEZI|nr:uncharacterized protein RCC_07570 [Ramularia collo-cygni]CZT21705.1 uncharacterized protein RCC_07570 [Ramularia collo-cygni]
MLYWCLDCCVDHPVDFIADPVRHGLIDGLTQVWRCKAPRHSSIHQSQQQQQRTSTSTHQHIDITMDNRSHPLLQQTPLTVNPFLDLPTPPTLPHTYQSLPSTLPSSALQSPPTATHPNLPAYITSPTGDFSAHPHTLLHQSRALVEQLSRQIEEGMRVVEEWERGIRERELAEKRRRAPGWLDSEVRVLEPERRDVHTHTEGEGNLMDEPVREEKEKGEGEDLGDAMDRAFGSGLGG